MNKQRRIFMLATATAGIGIGAMGSAAFAQTPSPMVSETDPQAAALGYVADATKVDKKKYPKHVASENCSNCQLYQGKPKEASGPCPLYPNKQVAAKGWCSAWVKKPA